MEEISSLMKSLKIAEAKEDKALQGNIHSQLSQRYHILGQYDKAIRHQEITLNIAKIIGNKAGEGGAYGNLGNSYHSLGLYDKAIKYHAMDLNIAKQIGDEAGEGRAYGNLGNCYASLGQYDKARKYSEMQLNIAKQIEQKTGEGAYGNLGNSYHSLGQYDKAIKHHEINLNIAKQIGDKTGEGSACRNLGSCYHSLGQYDKARKYYEMQLNIAKQTGDKAGEGSAYGNLGSYYLSLGQYDKAFEHHEINLNIAKQIGDKTGEGSACGNLGSCYHSLGQYDKAIKYHEMQLNIARKIGDKAGEGSAYGNLGSCYLSLGQYDKAIKHHEINLNIAKQTGDKAGEGGAYGNLGNCYASLGQYDKAIEHFKRDLRIAKQTGRKHSEAVSYHNLANCHMVIQQYEEGRRACEEALKCFETLFENVGKKDSAKISFIDIFIEAYKLMIQILLIQDKNEEALVVAERGRSKALAQLMLTSYRIRCADVSTSKCLDLSEILEVVKALSDTVLFYGLGVDNMIIRWVIQPSGNVQTQVTADVPLQVQKDPSEDSLVSKCVNLYSLIKKAKGLLTSGCMFECEDQDKEAELNSVLKELHQILLNPVLQFLKESSVVIVPDGPLALVPFAALMDENGRYAVETLRIRLVPSLATAKTILEHPPDLEGAARPLIIGDPEVGYIEKDGKTIPVPRVENAKLEAKAVAGHIDGQIFTGKYATKIKFLEKFESANFIHIAAHGDNERGEILFAPSPGTKRTKENVMLTISDLEGKHMRASLVVLSCSHSGRGEVRGEGVVGIARAFLGAGARAVLVSLWAINDEANMYFMKEFYEHLTEGERASEALHNAMTAMRGDTRFQHPRYWAPFVLIGGDVVPFRKS